MVELGFQADKFAPDAQALLLPLNMFSSTLTDLTLQLNTGKNLQMESTVGVFELTVSNLQANKSKDPTVSLIGSNGAATLASAFLIN